MTAILEAFTRAGVEGFVNPDDTKERRQAYSAMLVTLISFIIALLILSLVGKLLWNGVIVELFTFAKPARSVLQILGLFVFTSLVM